MGGSGSYGAVEMVVWGEGVWRSIRGGGAVVKEGEGYCAVGMEVYGGMI